MLQLSMKCWNSAFNAQSSRLIIVVVELGTVNVHVTAVEMLMKKERQGETQFTTKIDSFLSFIPPLNANVLILPVFFKTHPVYDQTQGYGAVLFLLYG